MIKKILTCFLMILISGVANANIHIDGKVAAAIIKEHIDEEHKLAASREYNAQLKATGNNTMSAAGLYKVCIAAGWNIEQPADKDKCDKFVEVLVEKSDYKYYEVCGKDKGKSGNPENEHCIDNVFYNIEVQLFQAKKLAQEYARVKYNDDIVCSNSTRPGTRNLLNDYLKCTSRLNPIYYEFNFDDLREGDQAKAKYRETQYHRAICSIYGGNAFDSNYDVAGKIVFGWFDPDTSDFVCKMGKNYSCSNLKDNISKNMGVSVTVLSETKCKISNLNPDAIVKYHAIFDGDDFIIYNSDNKPLKKWSARSGRGKTPSDERKTDCQLSRYQYCANIGPTPTGKYIIRQQDIQYAKDRTRADTTVKQRLLHWENYHWNGMTEDKSEISFGLYRVPLIPLMGTDVAGRDSMYVHGGRFAGSAGCIDLVQNNNDFFEWFQLQDSDLEIEVEYKHDEGQYCSSCNETVCKPCKCKEEINKTTHETNCEYI